MDAEPARLLGSTGYLLARLGAESRRRWATMLAVHRLSPHHFGVLMSLQQHGRLSQQQLSRAVGVDPRNLVAVLDLLEQQRLIDRRPDPSDRRRHAVGLTAAGQKLLETLSGAGDAVEQEFLEDLNEAERASLQALLLKLFRAVDRYNAGI